MKNLNKCALLVAVFMAGNLGCSKTILVSEASPIRTAQQFKIKIYTLQNGEWIKSDNEVTIQEGMYIVSPLWVKEEGK